MIYTQNERILVAELLTMTDEVQVFLAIGELPPRYWFWRCATKDQKLLWIQIKWYFTRAQELFHQYLCTGRLPCVPPVSSRKRSEHDDKYWKISMRIAQDCIDFLFMAKSAWQHIYPKLKEYQKDEIIPSPGRLVSCLMFIDAHRMFDIAFQGEFRVVVGDLLEIKKIGKECEELISLSGKYESLEKHKLHHLEFQKLWKKHERSLTASYRRQWIYIELLIGVKQAISEGNGELKTLMQRRNEQAADRGKKLYRFKSFGWRRGVRITPTGKAGAWKSLT